MGSESYKHPIQLDFGGQRSDEARSPEDEKLPRGVGAAYEEIEFSVEWLPEMPTLVLHLHDGKREIPMTWTCWREIAASMVKFAEKYHPVGGPADGGK